MFVYAIRNTVNGKQYVGQHSGPDLKRYWVKKKGYRRLRRQQALFNAVNKYGVEHFEIYPLKEVDTKEELDRLEKFYIRELNTKVPNGYNLTDGGEGTVGYCPTVETRLKISKSLSGVSKPNKLKGAPRTAETKSRISQALMGKPLSADHVQSLKRGSHNRWHHNRGVVNTECAFCMENK